MLVSMMRAAAVLNLLSLLFFFIILYNWNYNVENNTSINGFTSFRLSLSDKIRELMGFLFSIKQNKYLFWIEKSASLSKLFKMMEHFYPDLYLCFMK